MNLRVILVQGPCQSSLYRYNFSICAEASTTLHSLCHVLLSSLAWTRLTSAFINLFIPSCIHSFLMPIPHSYSHPIPTSEVIWICNINPSICMCSYKNIYCSINVCFNMHNCHCIISVFFDPTFFCTAFAFGILFWFWTVRR